MRQNGPKMDPNRQITIGEICYNEWKFILPYCSPPPHAFGDVLFVRITLYKSMVEMAKVIIMTYRVSHH